MLIEKKIELLPRSLKLRLCSSRLKKSLTSVKSIPLNIHDLEKCIYLDMTYIFMSSGIFFQNYYHTYHYQIFFNTWKKKLKKTPLRNRSYPLSLYYFLLDKSNQKKIKNTHWQMSDLGLGESLSASLSSFLFVVAKLFWALSDLLSSFIRQHRFQKTSSPLRILVFVLLSFLHRSRLSV